MILLEGNQVLANGTTWEPPTHLLYQPLGDEFTQNPSRENQTLKLKILFSLCMNLLNIHHDPFLLSVYPCNPVWIFSASISTKEHSCELCTQKDFLVVPAVTSVNAPTCICLHLTSRGNPSILGDSERRHSCVFRSPSRIS